MGRLQLRAPTWEGLLGDESKKQEGVARRNRNKAKDRGKVEDLLLLFFFRSRFVRSVTQQTRTRSAILLPTKRRPPFRPQTTSQPQLFL